MNNIRLSCITGKVKLNVMSPTQLISDKHLPMISKLEIDYIHYNVLVHLPQVHTYLILGAL